MIVSLRRTGRLAALAIAGSCLVAGIPGAAHAQSADTITGTWRTPTDGGSIVRIAMCGDAICGQIISSPSLHGDPGLLDRRNTNPELRTRRLQGLRILQVRADDRGRWTDGWVYNPRDGRTYRGSMTLTPDGRLRLTGCVVRPLCQTQTWTRVTG